MRISAWMALLAALLALPVSLIAQDEAAFIVMPQDQIKRYELPGRDISFTVDILRVTGERPIELDADPGWPSVHRYSGEKGTVTVEPDAAKPTVRYEVTAEEGALALFQVNYDASSSTITLPLGESTVSVLGANEEVRFAFDTRNAFRAPVRGGDAYRIIAPLNQGESTTLTITRGLPPTPVPTPTPTIETADEEANVVGEEAVPPPAEGETEPTPDPEAMP